LQVSPADSRRYFLNVENVHGNDRYAVSLLVKGESGNLLFCSSHFGGGKTFKRLNSRIFLST
jgi:hypothetical protein